MENRKSLQAYITVENLYSITRDLLQNWLAILLIAASAGMLINVWQVSRYKPLYTTKTTMVVMNYGVENYVYKNLQSASETAGRFSQLLKSEALQQIVAQEIGLDSFQGTVSANNPAKTNLLEFTVTAGTPRLAFMETKALLDNYHTFSQEVLGSINLVILEAPSVPTSPSNPMNPMRRVIQAVLLAGGAMILFLGGISVSRDTVRAAADVDDKLETRLLASVQHEDKNRNIAARIKNFRKKKSILITDPVTSFLYIETVKKLTARILNRMQEKGAKTLLVASVLENEGKSTIAANISLAMAQEGYRVLLIDADFRKPSQYKILNLQESEITSLNSYLDSSGDLESLEELSLPVPGSSLRVIVNKEGTPQSMESFSAVRIKKLIHTLAGLYDYVVIDSPPLQLVADAEELASMVETSVLVIRQHMAEARDLNDAIEALSGSSERILGCIFNNVHTSGFRMRGYGYGYGSRYGYGYGREHGGPNE